MTVKQENQLRIQQYIWLVGGILSLLAAFVFWVKTDSDALVEQSKHIEETQVAIQPEKVAATVNLGGLTDQVPPLQLTSRKMTSGNHLPEFRGTKFILDNKFAYTIEIFRVTNEDVIKSFLIKQVDRSNFQYFRLSGENQVEQYVLTYGVYRSEHVAMNAKQSLNLSLPKSVKPEVGSFEQFIELVNDLGSDEMVSSNNKLYGVVLKPVAVPVIDETVLARQALTQKVESGNTTTSTVITRRDQSGKVVEVQRSQTVSERPVVSEAPKTNNDHKNTETQISDPFN